ncbi:MAG: hypothetical protein PF450_01540, partial [Bacteroidales bacterium]|nr:hypothetical protein [Bacteroidales bacterium]
MKRTFRNLLKWFLRIILGLAALLVLLVLLFYLFRGKIVDRALGYVNDSQPGEVSIGKLNLRPFMNFPDVALQLKELNYASGAIDSVEVGTTPILQLEEIYVSLDLIKLIKGKYKVSNISLGDGEINYTVGVDSISNLEKALGIRFGQNPEADASENDSSILSFDLENIQIRNLTLNYIDIPGETNASLKINGLKSGVSYYPDLISANIMVHMDLNTATMNEIVLDKSRSVSLNVSMIYNQVSEEVDISRTALVIDDALFKLEGRINLSQQLVNLDFSLQNRGIDLLNFLLSGILNTDAIEQIGEGEIKFDGEVKGSYDKNIPEVKMNFSAREMGFNVHAINQKVTDIGFTGYASNGSAKDFSEAEFRLDNFHMNFPQGAIDANILLSNLITPAVAIDISGDADLSIFNEILNTGAVHTMKGSVAFEGAIDGIVDREAGAFLEDAGGIALKMQNVSFALPGHEVESINGELFIEEKSLGFRNMQVRIDSSTIDLNGEVDYLLPYLLGFSADPAASLTFSSRELYYHKLLGDSLYKEPLKNLRFNIAASILGSELEKALKTGSIPKVNLALNDLEVKIPGYAEISRVDLDALLDEDNLSLKNFSGFVGESQIKLEAQLENYGAYLEKDSAAEVAIKFDLFSRVLRARDLLSINDEFTILPLEFIDEEMEDFKFKGTVKTTVQELLTDSILPNFKFQCEKLELDLKYYPHSINNFAFEIEHDDSLIIVNKFRGSVGSNNLLLQASLSHLLDSSKTITGSLDLQSDLLNISELLDYELVSGKGTNPTLVKDSVPKTSVGLEQIDFPDLA